MPIFTGTNGPDDMRLGGSSAIADTINGLGGNDTINGRGGSDLIDGGSGDDEIQGGTGNDTIRGGSGNDAIAGDTAAAILAGADVIYGEAGTDTISGGIGNDTLDGGADNDIISGDAGDDSLQGGGGQDSLSGGIGNDQISGDSDSVNGGADSIDGGAGDDTISGGMGNDTILADGHDSISGADSVDGGSGHDSILGNGGNDTLNGDAGDDTIRGGTGSDIIDGGGDNDLLEGGDDDDRLSGGSGTDFMDGGSGNDSLDGGAGEDRVNGDDGNDTLTGGAGFDMLDGDAGNDLLLGGGDFDELAGEAGDDTLDGGAGPDQLFGGHGNDQIITGLGDQAQGGDDRDTFTLSTADGGSGPFTIDGGSGSTAHGDVDDYDSIVLGPGLSFVHGSMTKTLDEASGPGMSWSGSFRVTDGTHTYTVHFQEIENLPICFTRGSLIETLTGPQPVEALKAGDLIRTRDNGFKPIRWIGSRVFAHDRDQPSETLCPIRIRAGALGAGLPSRDLSLSPQHRVLVRSRIARRMFCEDEVLVAVKHLVDLPGIEAVTDFAEVEYFHILFDQHEIVYANGLEAESLHTGPQALKSLDPAALAEVLTLFPELADPTPDAIRQMARPAATGRQARQLAHRHVKHGLPLQ